MSDNVMAMPFAVAFETWETRFRDHPEEFLTHEQVAAMAAAPLSERRAACLIAILDTLANDGPWMSIVKPEDPPK